eukprot:SAG11_NODE_18876_length_479_cov_1.065789_2_plen_86_part_00
MFSWLLICQFGPGEELVEVADIQNFVTAFEDYWQETVLPHAHGELLPGGDGPLQLVTGYQVVRTSHFVVFFVWPKRVCCAARIGS